MAHAVRLLRVLSLSPFDAVSTAADSALSLSATCGCVVPQMLRTIGRRLVLLDNQLETLHGLHNLHSVGKYAGNPTCPCLTAWGAARRPPGRSTVDSRRARGDPLTRWGFGAGERAEALSSEGGVTVVNNGALRSLEGLDSLTDVHGHLSVRNNSALTSLAGSNVSFVQLSVEVRRCYPPCRARSLSLSRARRLPRRSLPLRRPSRLPAYATHEAAHPGRRQVSDNGALTSLHGLHHLTQLGP
jgi:hypothetical protein